MIEFLKPFSTGMRSVFRTFLGNAAIGRALIFCAGPLLSATVWADPIQASPDVAVVTNLAQLSQLSSQNPKTSYRVCLEGDILWADTAQGEFVLRDASGAGELGMDLRGLSLEPGQRVRLDGESTITRRGAGVQLGVMGPVVDDDGVHTMIEKSGAVYLPAGRQTIRVDWFNGVEKYGLTVEYQGPGLPRQKIPDSALFRNRTDDAGVAHFVNGLDYAC